VYDPFGGLAQTIDPLGNVVTSSHDLRGRKIRLVDPDMGTWTYTYDALGQLISQTNGQTSTVSYDLGGRITARAEPDLSSAWTAVLSAVREWVKPALKLARDCYWIVDDTGFPKKGQHSVGVARQYYYQAQVKSVARATPLPARRSAAVNTLFATMLFLFRELLGRGLARMVGRPWWLVYQSKSRAIGWINAIGRTCPCPDSVASRVVLHSPAGPVLLPSEIRAPHFYCINHARRTYAARYSLFEPKTRILDCPPTWSQNALCACRSIDEPLMSFKIHGGPFPAYEAHRS